MSDKEKNYKPKITPTDDLLDVLTKYAIDFDHLDFKSLRKIKIDQKKIPH